MRAPGTLLVVAMTVLLPTLADAQFLPPGQEPLVSSIFGASGCRVRSARVEQEAAVADLACDAGDRRVELVHPSTDLDATPTRGVLVRVTPDDPRLEAAMRDAIEDADATIAWITPEATAPPPEPPRAMERRKPPLRPIRREESRVHVGLAAALIAGWLGLAALVSRR
ncbi:MAG: hypothetical protein AB7S26_37335 [Sandaracinaceae bacterium]